MCRIKFSEEEINALFHERNHHPHPRVQKKMDVVYLTSQKLQAKEVCRLARVSDNTRRTYLQEYQQGRIERLKQLNFHQPQSQLMEYHGSLEAYFREHPPVSINEARAKITELTGIERSPTQVRVFLRSLGMRCRRVGQIPAKADPEKQAEFLANELQPRLDEAQAGKRAVFFTDAAHFVLKPYLGYLWCFVRIYLQAPCGRQRLNVLGALNAVDQNIVTVINQTYITSAEVCALLTKLAALGMEVPITVVMDNARYQRCQMVMAHAASLGIELLFLPSYSPNLNLIERLWKFVKKQCLYSQYYDKFDKFQEAITNCLNDAPVKHQKELKSLLTLKFQTFEKPQIMPV